MRTDENINQVSMILKTIAHPSRLAILLAIGAGETCVCHLETLLSLSQSHISQQLIALRRVGVVATRRENRFIHYRLTDPALLGVIDQVAQMKGISLPVLQPLSKCNCSNCCQQK